jgi:dTDP-4-amino-4,6-dideoxygalactose transaminase
MMTTQIPLIEPVVGEQESANVADVLASGYMTEGPVTASFEERYAELVGAAHGIAVTSCTTGMELALEACGVGAGDEVIIPDFTHPATGNVVVRVGATPVLVDVDPVTYNIDPTVVEAAITDRTAALLPVAWGGQPLDPAPFNEAADRHDLWVVEDAACSVGASFGGTPVGSQFDVSVFSLHPRKVLTTGEGGMITTDDDELARRIRSKKRFGVDPAQPERGFQDPDATNYKFSDILAAVGMAQLDRVDAIVQRRQEIAERYDELLADVPGVTAPATIDGGEHNYQCYCVYLEAGDDDLQRHLIEVLKEDAIETQIGTYALSVTEAFAEMPSGGELVHSVDLYRNLLTLPVAHSMTDADQRRVVDALESAISAY